MVPLVAMAVRTAVAGSAAAWSRDRVIANAGQIISDIERFRERTGAYPVAISSVWPDYHAGIIGIECYRYEPSGKGYNLYFEHPSTNLAAREIVMYNPRGEQDISSHAFDLLQLSPEEIRRQRGYSRVVRPAAGWVETVPLRLIGSPGAAPQPATRFGARSPDPRAWPGAPESTPPRPRRGTAPRLSLSATEGPMVLSRRAGLASTARPRALRPSRR